MKTELEKYLKSKFHEATCGSYLYAIDRFLDTVSSAEKCDYMQVVEYMAGMHRGGYAHQYKVASLAAIKQYFNFLVDTGKRNDHPCQHLTINDHAIKGICFDDLLSPDELEKLFDRPVRYALNHHRNQIIISLLIYQGLTSQEICCLKVDDIDLDSCMIQIRKNGKLNARKLEMHRKQVLLFSEYLQKTRPKLNKFKVPELLLNKLGNPDNEDSIKNILSVFESMLSGKRVNAQNIRSSVIANWLNYYRIPLSDVQLMAGHRWPTTTQKYIQTDKLKKRDAINLVHPMESMFTESGALR